MNPIGGALRRTLLLVMLAAGVGMVLSWRRGQATTPTPSEPPQWPALPGRSEQAAQPAPSAQSDRTGRTDDEQSCVPANDDGSAPDTHPVKAKASSGIFHVPGGRFYDRTRPDRCYPTAAAAEADGYRLSKS